MRRADLTEAVRKTLERYQPPHDAHYGVVPTPPPLGALSLSAMPPNLAAAMRGLNTARVLTATQPNHFALTRILVRQEAVTSSAIEGTHSTLDAVLSADENESTNELTAAKEDTDTATTQVRDYALALEKAIVTVSAEGRAAFSRPMIEGLHRAVMSGDPDYKDEPGSIRDSVVWIGGGRDIGSSIFNPPPPGRVERCLADHVDYLRDDGMSLMEQSIIARLAVGHAHFEAVHPFRDGNGRVGRLLIPLMMAADGHTPLYIAPYIAHQKDAYIAGLKDAQQRLAYAPLIEFLSAAILATVEEAETTFAAIGQLAPVWAKRGKFRKGSAAMRALGVLPGYPIVTARRLSNELKLSFKSANEGIAQLVGAGVLTELTGHRRNRLFAARDVLRIFNRSFGEEPDLPEV